MLCFLFFLVLVSETIKISGQEPNVLKKRTRCISEMVEDIMAGISTVDDKVAALEAKLSSFLGKKEAEQQPTCSDPDWKIKCFTDDCYCYRRFVNASSWQHAKESCEKHDSHLITIHSQEEQDFAFKFSGALSWIGLNDLETEGTFQWVDLAPQVYTNWKKGEPNNHNKEEHCGSFENGGTWNDLKCSHIRNYACQKKQF